jgi:hypothetical protein
MPVKPSKRFGSKLESKFLQRRYLAMMGQQVRKYDYVYYRGVTWRKTRRVVSREIKKYAAGFEDAFLEFDSSKGIAWDLS